MTAHSGVPQVLPWNMPERIFTWSASRRGVDSWFRPGARRSISFPMASKSSSNPEGSPSSTTPMAGPWDSPNMEYLMFAYTSCIRPPRDS